ncbi:unnamed protein product, partial [Closterium sp. NIES-53]
MDQQAELHRSLLLFLPVRPSPRYFPSQDFIPRGGKLLPLYSRVVEAGAPPAIVLPATEGAPRAALREGDVWWSSFLAEGQRATESSTS